MRVRIDRIDVDLLYYTLHVSMGKHIRERQLKMSVATTNFPTAASHPFYTRLTQRLAEHFWLSQSSALAEIRRVNWHNIPIALIDLGLVHKCSLSTPEEELARQFSRIASVDSVFLEGQKRTSNVYCLVRTPCTAVPGAVLTALISLPRPMMTMLQVPSG